MKSKIHKEWFQPIKKNSCPCGNKKIQVFSWGEYVTGKWRTVDYFCENCFKHRIIKRLQEHATGCGCNFELVPRSGHKIPTWISI